MQPVTYFITMYKVKLKLLYNEEKTFWTKTELLNFKLTLSFAKLVMVAARSGWTGLIFGQYPS